MLRPHLSSTLFPYTTLFRSVAVPLLAPQTVFEPRRTQLDLRLTKFLGLSRGRLQLNLDVYNALNASDVVTQHQLDRKSTRLNSSHRCISYAVFCLKKKIQQMVADPLLPPLPSGLPPLELDLHVTGVQLPHLPSHQQYAVA